MGNAYLNFDRSEDLDKAEYWYSQMLLSLDERDRQGRATALGQMGLVAVRRFDLAVRKNEARDVVEQHWRIAEARLQEDLRLAPPDAVEHLAVTNQNLGALYSKLSGAIETVKQYNQQALKLFERANRPLQAAAVRVNMADALRNAGRPREALDWARAGLRGYENAGSAVAGTAKRVADFIRALEHEVGE